MRDALKNLNAMSLAPNYNNWIFSNIKPYIGQRILEVGCGIGNMTQFFIDREKVISIDISDECLDIIKDRFSQETNFQALNYDVSSDKVLELNRHRIDTIICINVLEHIRDDSKALRNMYQILNNKGKLILLVPAFERLYGTIDQTNRHYRRYEKIELKRRLLKCGFIIHEESYLNLLGIPVWILHGKILRK
ncbi:class I SAM-dependent methyltransferase, partial [bacterium]|nr:class I SAM-dependent methyltransferase [bacterium]